MSEVKIKRLPRYRCHKEVSALKIEEVLPKVYENESENCEGDGSRIIIPEDKQYDPFTVDYAYFSKHDPKAGGYYVVYADGYKSYSPAAAFESGYTKI